jgi:hypothetical protein
MENYNGYSGSFTQPATAADVFLTMRSDIDWIEVWNETTIKAGGNGARSFYFQRGMAATDFIYRVVAAGAYDETMPATTGFILTDTSIVTAFAPIAITNVSAAGVVLTANTTGLSIGDLVRLYTIVPVGAAVGGHQLEGIDWQVTAINPGVSFTIGYAPAIVDTGVITGVYKKIQYADLYLPHTVVITAITAANPAVVSTSRDHGLTVGQKVRIMVPDVCGMREINNRAVTITAVTANTFTTDISSVGFTPFVFPATAAAPCNQAMVVPFGNAAEAVYVNSFDDAKLNVSAIGVTLKTGAALPAGVANDVIHWRAGKSAVIDND